VLSPKDSPLGKVIEQYVPVRVTQMDNVDVGLFERDWNNAIYFFALNADEQIYVRYGGRDSNSADTYLNLESMERGLTTGLDMHRRWQAGELKLPPRPAPFLPRQIPLLVQRTYARHACVECHLIGDFQNIQREEEGKLDKLTHLYRSPDIKTIGIELDVPKGLVVKEARGAVAAAGMKAGDRIAAIEGTPVVTFGDLQYRYDKVDRTAKQMAIAVEREGRMTPLTLTLPDRWWWTDLRFRQSSVDPRLDFEDRPLTDEERRKLGLRADGFASQVKHVSALAGAMKTHDLREGDVIAAVNGVERDELANTAELYLKLHVKAGDSAMLDVIRQGKRMKMQINSHVLSFRK
jgi:serine protease Do